MGFCKAKWGVIIFCKAKNGRDYLGRNGLWGNQRGRLPLFSGYYKSIPLQRSRETPIVQ